MQPTKKAPLVNEIEPAKIAGYMHDTGNSIFKVDYSERKAYYTNGT